MYELEDVMSINKARQRVLSGPDGPNPFRDRSLSNPEGINQYTKGGGAGKSSEKDSPRWHPVVQDMIDKHAGGEKVPVTPSRAYPQNNNPSTITPTKFDGPHGRVSVRPVPSGTHAGSIRVKITKPGFTDNMGNTLYGNYHTKDPVKAIEAAKIFHEKGETAFLEHWNKGKERGKFNFAGPLQRAQM
jgi:hypothetical protein